MQKYDHVRIEKKWQAQWEKDRLYTVSDSAESKENFYLLVEFPYPSGNLHVGHWYAFAVPDMLARIYRMQGKNVLYPIGFDAFGLPAENAAIKNKLNPREWTEKNIAHMTKQIRSMGTSFDWSRAVSTIDPSYYRWTQWMFNQFLKKGLAYRKETAVNWCSSCKTVLANEQVVDGKCERCSTEVIQKEMLQWNLKITDYADRLVDDLDALDWPEPIKDAQRAWIGRSEGAEIDFHIGHDRIVVFTTRPDTLFGATYLVLAPEHPYLEAHKGSIRNWQEVEGYIAVAQKKTELERQTEQKEKTGVRLEGISAINPATEEEIPVFVADYVLGSYGTGAIMAVPAHDARDYAFAKKFDLPIRQVVRPVFGFENKAKGEMVYRETVSAIVRRKDGKIMLLDWPKNKWITTVIGGLEKGEAPGDAAEREVLEETGYKARALFVSPIRIESFFYADHKQEWRWRVDTPVLLELTDEDPDEVAPEEREKHTPRWVTPEEARNSAMYGNNKLAIDLALGRVEAYTAPMFGERAELVNSDRFDGHAPEEAKRTMAGAFGRAKKTYRLRDWVVSRQRYWGVPIPVVHCPACGTVPVPDTDLPILLPEVEDYLPAGDGKSPLAKAREWVEVPCPSCGKKAERETDTLDTFVDSSWYFLRYTDPNNEKEFASKKNQGAWMPIDLYSGGAEHTTMHVLYSRFWHKALYDLGFVADQEPYTRRMNRSLIMGPDGQKMSKSRGNVIDPDAVVECLGADTVRMYLAFIGPYNEVGSYPWNPDGVVGVRRFIERAWKAEGYVQEEVNDALERPLHKAIKKVSDDGALLKFNTAISALMIFLNALEKEKRVGKEQWRVFLRLLAPFAPHIAEELWHGIGETRSVHLESWPRWDSTLVRDEAATIAVQINGKTRATAEVPADADEAAHESAARAAIGTRLEGQDVIKTIVVRGRMVNFVARG